MKRALGPIVLFAGLAAAAPAFLSPSGDRNVKLNDTLAFGFFGDVQEGYQLSPDGSRVVYVADQETAGTFEVYSAPSTGGPSVKLNGPVADGGDISKAFQISPDGSTVVYAGDQDVDQIVELYSVPIDGSELPTKLNGPLVLGGDVIANDNLPLFFVASDSSRVVYRADQETSGTLELYSVPIDGSELPIKLSMPIVGADVISALITPDASRVLFTADVETVIKHQLFSVPLDGSQPAVRLNEEVPNGSRVEEFRVTPDSSRVVYRADHDVLSMDELYSAPVDGSAPPVKLSAPLVAFGNLRSEFQLTSDGQCVVYRAFQTSSRAEELFSVPVDGSQTAVKISGALVMDGDVSAGFRISGDDTRVVYTADQDVHDLHELYSVPIDGSAAPIKLNPVLVTDGDVLPELEVSPDGSLVVYAADQDVDERIELYSVPIDGSSGPTKLNDPLPPGGGVVATSPALDTFALTPDGARVVYWAVVDTPTLAELFSVPIDAGEVPVKLSGAFVPGGISVPFGFQISTDSSRVVYRAQQDQRFAFEIYSASVDGSAAAVKVNGPLSVALAGDVLDFELSPDESTVVYRGDQDVNDIMELYAVPVDASSEPIRLNDPLVLDGDVMEFAISPDGARVVYRADQDDALLTELYSVPLDGSAPSIKLSEATPSFNQVGDFEISSDGSRVVYLADQDTTQVLDLYSVPTDGSLTAVRLNIPLVINRDITGFAISPDGTTVVFIADQDTLNRNELYSVPIDGSAAPTKLSAPLVSTGDVTVFQIAPDSSCVAYVADQNSNNVLELYNVPIDGTTTATKLSGPMVFGGNVLDFRISADSSRVVYQADQETNGVNELFTVPADGSSSATKLNEPLAGNLFAYEISSDSTRVVYRAAQETVAIEIFSVPIDGSSTPVKLNQPFFPGAATNEFAITPDSSRVVFRGDLTVDDRRELYSVPIDGSSAPITLSGMLVAAGDVMGGLGFSGDGTRVVYLADARVDGVEELYMVPPDGSLPPTAVSAPPNPGGNASEAYLVNFDRSVVVYLADQETAQTFELFATAFELAIDRVRPRIGPFEGGNTIYLEGCAFEPEAQVSFGRVPATSVTVLSSTELQIVVPPSLTSPQATRGPGTGKLRRGRIKGVTVDVTVSNGGRETTLAGAYTYLPIRY